MNWSWWSIFVVLLIATAWDIARRRVPNWLVLPFLAAGPILSGIRHGLSGVEASLGGIAVAVALVGPFCWLRGMGVGDLKLCAGIGAWLGPGELVLALVITAIAGGVIAVSYAAWHRSLGRSLVGTGDLVAGLFRGKSRVVRQISLDNPAALSIPYVPAIAIGTVFVLLTSHG